MFEDKNWEPKFAQRMERHYAEMKWLYSELYHNDQKAFDYFCDMLHDYYQERTPLLKEWDEAREAVRSGTRATTCSVCSCIQMHSQARSTA